MIFPVNPDSFQVAQTRSFGTYDLVAGKQGMQIGQLQLRQITLSSFLPAVYDEDYCVGHYLDYCGDKGENPMVAVYWLQDQMKAKKNLYFAGLPISQGDQEPGQQVLQEMPCHITSFTYTYQSGNPRDVFFDLELTEYRDLKVTKTSGKPPSGPKDPVAKKYTTKIGDSFIDIAKAQYGPNYGNLATKLKANNPNVEYADPKKKAIGSAIKKGTSIKLDVT